MKVTSVKKGDKNISIGVIDENLFMHSIKISGVTECQQKAFNDINVQVNKMINHENPFEDRHSLFVLSSMKWNEKAKKYILGGTMAQHRYAEYEPYSWTLPDKETAKIMYAEKSDSHYLSVQFDTAILIEAFLKSIEIEIFVQSNEIIIDPVDIYKVGNLFADNEQENSIT